MIHEAFVEVENAGQAVWRPKRRGQGIDLCYHWLDPLGAPVVWDGLVTALPNEVAPGERVHLTVRVAAPIPPGRYTLSIDLVESGRFWFAELGNPPLEQEVWVAPRIGRTLAVTVSDGPPDLVAATRLALDAQQEPVQRDGEATAFLAAGCEPVPEWSRRILDAHEAGYAAVGGSITVSGRGRQRRAVSAELEAWSPPFGRAPSWPRVLLCPSLVTEAVPQGPWVESVAGLPALDPSSLIESWLCDGRIEVRVQARALQPCSRPDA